MDELRHAPIVNCFGFVELESAKLFGDFRHLAKTKTTEFRIEKKTKQIIHKKDAENDVNSFELYSLLRNCLENIIYDIAEVRSL